VEERTANGSPGHELQQKGVELSAALGIGRGDVVTVVGAGGKSSLLMTVAREMQRKKWAFLLTSTTKMFYHQVREFTPVISGDYQEGSVAVADTLARCGYAAWFSERRDIKLTGIAAEWLDSFYEAYHGAEPLTLLIEGDGARQRLLKAPGSREPVIPKSCTVVVGVLNVRAVGEEMSPETVHRYEEAVKILDRERGLIEPRDIAALAVHPAGIFKGFSGKTILVLAGVDKTNEDAVREVVEQLAVLRRMAGMSADPDFCLPTEGFGYEMKQYIL